MKYQYNIYVSNFQCGVMCKLFVIMAAVDGGAGTREQLLGHYRLLSEPDLENSVGGENGSVRSPQPDQMLQA